MAAHYIYFKRNKQSTIGTGFCTLMAECRDMLVFREVNGTMTITDNTNTLMINIVNDVATVPTIVGKSVSGSMSIGIREIRREENQPMNIRQYQLHVGQLFTTQFIVKDNEFIQMAKEVKIAGGGVSALASDCNVINMKISFKLEGEMILTRKS